MSDPVATPAKRGPLGFWTRLQLWQRVMIGLVLGVAVGQVWGAEVVQIKWIGELFVRLIRMLVAPLIFATISSGVIALGDPKRMGRLGLSDTEEDALVSFMQTLTDGFMSRDQR